MQKNQTQTKEGNLDLRHQGRVAESDQARFSEAEPHVRGGGSQPQRLERNVYLCLQRDHWVKATHVDTSAMCLCLRVSHRSSSSSSTTSFIRVSPIPLVSKLQEREEEEGGAVWINKDEKARDER